MSRAASHHSDLLGRFVRLRIRDFSSAGAHLVHGGGNANAPAILLLGAEIPEGARTGDEVDVFVYLDSEDRPLATTARPKLALGEVAFLRVTARADFGAFVDWGLPKELLVPFAQQTKELNVGAREPIGLYLDGTKRLAGTMRVSELLAQGSEEFQEDEWVHGEAWRNDPEIGLFVIVERRFVGLVPRYEPHNLRRGEAARFRVNHVQPDGRLELSLRGHAHEELETDAQRVFERLSAPGAPLIGDQSSPEQIRREFGLSKKAFKRAVGRLLKQGVVTLDANGRVIARRDAR